MYNKDNFLNSFCQFLSFYLPYFDYFICNICYCFLVALDYNYLYSIIKTQKSLTIKAFHNWFIPRFLGFYEKSYTIGGSLLTYRFVVNSLLYDKLLPRESSRPSVSFCCMGGLKRLSELLKFSYTSLINLPLQNIVYELYISAFVFI